MHPHTELVPLLRGELSAAERERVQHHLDGCADCREASRALAATMRTVAERLEELPTPQWSAYRRELRLKLAARKEPRTRWWRTRAAWASLATAGAAAAALLLVEFTRPAPHPAASNVDVLAMEEPAENVDVGLLDNYPMVEKLDLLENYDVIENLDQAPSGNHSDDTRS